MSTVAVFGGSFNPPHVAHVLAGAYVLSTFEVDQLLIVPAWSHPLGKNLAPFEHRVELCKLAFRDLQRTSTDPLERDLGESRTLLVLRALRERHPDWKLRLVIGSDILAETHKWFAWDEVVALAPPILLGRAGHPHPEAPLCVLPEVASRDVRSNLARGEDVHALLPREVLNYIREHKLYEATP